MEEIIPPPALLAIGTRSTEFLTGKHEADENMNLTSFFMYSFFHVFLLKFGDIYTPYFARR
jgi:hypothetical protein